MELIKLKKNQNLSFIPFNRDVKLNITLKKSLLKYGFIDPVKVIKTSVFGVKNGLYVIDGQHRYTIAKSLDMEIPYIIIGEYNKIVDLVYLMATFNNTQQKWTVDNYVNCYAATDDENYKFIRRKKGETQLTYPLLVVLYTDSLKTVAIKKGLLLINNKSNGDILLNYLIELEKISSLPARAKIGFIRFVRNHKNYNHNIMLLNYKHHNKLITLGADEQHYINIFQKIYSQPEN